MSSGKREQIVFDYQEIEAFIESGGGFNESISDVIEKQLGDKHNLIKYKFFRFPADIIRQVFRKLQDTKLTSAHELIFENCSLNNNNSSWLSYSNNFTKLEKQSLINNDFETIPRVETKEPLRELTIKNNLELRLPNNEHFDGFGNKESKNDRWLYNMLEGLEYLDLSCNNINFQNGTYMRNFVNEITQLKKLKQLRIHGNPFIDEYPEYKNYFFRDFYLAYKKDSEEHENLDNFRLNDSVLNINTFKMLYERNTKAWKEWGNIFKESTQRNSLNEHYSGYIDDEENPEGLKNFKSYIQFLEMSLWNPAESTTNLNKLKDRVNIVVDNVNEKRGVIFDDSKGQLKDDVDSFMSKIIQQVDSQDDIHDITVEIISKLTCIKQADIGKLSYELLTVFSRKGKHFRKTVRKFLMENCITQFKISSLDEIYELHLNGFVDVVKSNKYNDVFDDVYVDYINKWLNEILIHGLDQSEMDHDKNDHIFQINQNPTIIACIFNFVILCIKQAFRQKPSFYQQLNLLMTIFVKIRLKRYSRGFFQNTFYLSMITYLTKALKYFVKNKEENDVKKYLAGQLLDIGKFYSEVLQELEELKNEIIQVLSNGISNEEANYFVHLETTLESVLLMVVEIQKTSQRTINVNDDMYVRNANSGESIFYDIAQIYNLKSKLSINLKTIIIKFCYKTLSNRHLTTRNITENNKNEDEFEHRAYVLKINEFLNDMQESMDILKAAKDNPDSEENIALGIALCKLYLFYFESAIKKVEHDRQGENDLFQEPWGDICEKVLDQLEDGGIDLVLFNGLSVDNDNFKLAIANVLNMKDVDQFCYEDTIWISSLFQCFKNVGSGKNEKVCGTLYLILTKIIKFSDRKKVTEIIIQKGEYLVNEALDILLKNSQRDLRQDHCEQEEKDELSVCITQFLKTMIEGITDLQEEDHNQNIINPQKLFQIVKGIILNEYYYNPKSAISCDIEKSITRCCEQNLIKFLIQSWRKDNNFEYIDVKATNYVYFRLLNHLADLAGGYIDPWYNNSIHDHWETNKQSAQKWKLHHITNFNIEWKKSIIENELLLSNMTKMKIKDRKEKDSCIAQENFENIIPKTQFDKIFDNITACHQMTDLLNNLNAQVEEYYSPVSRWSIATNTKASGGTFFQSSIQNDYYEAEENYNIMVMKAGSKRKNNHIGDFMRKKGLAKQSQSIKRVEKFTRDLRYQKNESESMINAEKVFQHPMTPQHIKRKSKLNCIHLKDFVNEGVGDIEYEKKMLCLCTCAYLRFLDNILTRLPKSPDSNITNIVAQLNKGSFIEKIVNICDKAGWSDGFISSKFQDVIKKMVHILFYVQKEKRGKNGLDKDDFKKKIEIYGIIFKAIDKVLIFLQNRLSSDAQVTLSWEDLYTINYQSRTCYEVIDSIKKLIVNSDSETVGVKEYNIHSMPEVTKLVIVQKILRNSFPLSYLYTFILCYQKISTLKKTEKDIGKYSEDVGCDYYADYTEYASKHEIEKEIRCIIRDLISDYIAMMPKYKYVITKYFYDIEQMIGARSCNCIIYEILVKSTFCSKQLHLRDYLMSKDSKHSLTYQYTHKKDAHKEESKKRNCLKLPEILSLDSNSALTFIPGEKIVYASEVLFSDKKYPLEHFEVGYILITTEKRIYLLRRTDRKPCSGCAPDSLCPAAPLVAFCIYIDCISIISRVADKRSIVVTFNRERINSSNLMIDLMENLQREKFLDEVKKLHEIERDFYSKVQGDNYLLRHLYDFDEVLQNKFDAVFCGIIYEDAINEELYNQTSKLDIFAHRKKILLIFKNKAFHILEMDKNVFELLHYSHDDLSENEHKIDHEKNVFKKLKQYKEDKIFNQDEIVELRYENTQQPLVTFQFDSSSLTIVLSDNNEREDFKRYLSTKIKESMQRDFHQQILQSQVSSKIKYGRKKPNK